MSNEPKRPYYDPNAKSGPTDRALVVAPEHPRRDFVTWVYNWLTQRYEPYQGEQQSKKP